MHGPYPGGPSGIPKLAVAVGVCAVMLALNYTLVRSGLPPLSAEWNFGIGIALAGTLLFWLWWRDR